VALPALIIIKIILSTKAALALHVVIFWKC